MLMNLHRLLSRKTVTFSFSQPYDFIPSTLASRGVATSGVTPSLCDEKPESLIWCVIVDHLRTYFSSQSVLNKA